ncbi:hypothetical protein [Parafrankia sp. BMG5.11]|uniref:hypothetical protein n=1 Tax=Parafrankia sp. BMG5.11 TaxID=222540 RepID=UPI00103F3563|nr:hypothetical protein [Parafrankia sp. BMG5.11]TCJ34678.1 hypothetical protein E0504_32315 [Parafrankia sp. BMG5.11]
MPESSTPLPALAGSVAAELGDDWKTEAGNWPEDAFLVKKSNPLCKIHVRMGRSYSRRDKIEISGVYPHRASEYRTGRAPRDRTYAAPNKSAVAIARQIQRYVLPGYEAELARVCGILDSRRRMQQRAEEIARDVMAAFGLPWTGLDPTADEYQRDRWVPVASFWRHPQETIRNFSADPMHGGEVEFKFSAHADHAVKIAEFLASLPPVE